ncbi:RNA polymerase sigma factor [Agathobaculum sp. NTUH-O15-33]|uniref:RNA polymerase sigma factor n=1 Tax=Agathobaculum sp. NTUH-O15-33 TaxID=3079302 RepID=UPI0029588BB8|nr:RNA polymerase sigma factor [Agathobaculum sp. NTUH-O15-33]WNX84117.1 RNA polymerase sigma factor [Agathobaculum sp. NTUH-O15-33]
MEMILTPAASDLHARFCAAVTEHKLAMYRAARALSDCDADAEDAVSEAILRAWQAFPRLRDHAAIKGWLIRITVNCAHEHRRKDARVTYMDDLTAVAGGKSDTYDSGLWDTVCRLPMDFRAVTVLYYFEDMTTAEIAKALGVREGTVRSRLARARDRLRTLLEEE